MAKARNEEEFTVIRVRKTAVKKLNEIHSRKERINNTYLHRYDVIEEIIDNVLNVESKTV